VAVRELALHLAEWQVTQEREQVGVRRAAHREVHAPGQVAVVRGDHDTRREAATPARRDQRMELRARREPDQRDVARGPRGDARQARELGVDLGAEARQRVDTGDLAAGDRLRPRRGEQDVERERGPVVPRSARGVDQRDRLLEVGLLVARRDRAELGGERVAVAEIPERRDHREPRDIVERGERAEQQVREEPRRRDRLDPGGADEHDAVRNLARVVVIDHHRRQPLHDRARAAPHVEHDERVSAAR